VVCDLTMPAMDGWETLEVLRRMRPGLPVILTSGYDEAQAMKGDHAELPQVFLQKPYGMEALKGALQRALRGKGL
jgi:CheY-like chemotaxis protein